MANVEEKLKNLMDTLAKDGNIRVSVNFLNGAVSINGIDFTPEEQFLLMTEYSNNPLFTSLMEKINSTPEASKIRNVVKFDGGKFQVDVDKTEKTFGIELDRTEDMVYKNTESSKVDDKLFQYKPPQDEKDREIDQLKKEVEELKRQLKVAKQESESDKSLKFPDSFSKTLGHPLHKDTIQELLDDLKETEIPLNSYSAKKFGDTLLIKMRDENGLIYVVTSDFRYATVNLN